MKKKILGAITCVWSLLLLMTLAACADVREHQTASVSFAFDRAALRSAISANARASMANTSVQKNLVADLDGSDGNQSGLDDSIETGEEYKEEFTVKLALLGDYTSVRSLTISQDGIGSYSEYSEAEDTEDAATTESSEFFSLTFDNVPVGANVYARAVCYVSYSNEEKSMVSVIGFGSSSAITIAPGDNPLSLPLGYLWSQGVQMLAKGTSSDVDGAFYLYTQPDGKYIVEHESLGLVSVGYYNALDTYIDSDGDEVPKTISITEALYRERTSAELNLVAKPRQQVADVTTGNLSITSANGITVIFALDVEKADVDTSSFPWYFPSDLGYAESLVTAWYVAPTKYTENDGTTTAEYDALFLFSDGAYITTAYKVTATGEIKKKPVERGTYTYTNSFTDGALELSAAETWADEDWESASSSVRSIVVSDGVFAITPNSTQLTFYYMPISRLVTSITAFFPVGYEDKTVAAWYVRQESETTETSDGKSYSVKNFALYLFTDFSFIETKYKQTIEIDGSTTIETSVEQSGTYSLSAENDYYNNTGIAVGTATYNLSIVAGLLTITTEDDVQVLSYQLRSDAVPAASEVTETASADTTTYMLYAQSNGSYAYYASDEADIANVLTSATPTFTAGTDKFCFDADGNCYVLDYDSGSETNTIKSNKQGFSDVVLSDGLYNTRDTYGITVDRTENILYGYSINEQTITLYAFAALISSGDATSTSCEITLTNPTDASASVYAEYCVVDSGTAYFVCSDSNSQYYVAPVGLDGSSSITGNSLISLSLESSGFSSNVSVTDAWYQSDAVYVLLRDVSGSWTCSTSESAVYSRGAVVRVDIATSTVSTIGLQSSASLQPSAISNMYLYSTDKDALYTSKAATERSLLDGSQWLTYNQFCSAVFPTVYGITDTTATTFAGPRKFIAVTPKKLVIADDGYAFYVDDSSALCFKNCNRVVTVDLEEFALADITEVSVPFDGDETVLNSSASIQSLSDGSFYYSGSYYRDSGSDVTKDNVYLGIAGEE